MLNISEITKLSFKPLPMVPRGRFGGYGLFATIVTGSYGLRFSADLIRALPFGLDSFPYVGLSHNSENNILLVTFGKRKDAQTPLKLNRVSKGRGAIWVSCAGIRAIAGVFDSPRRFSATVLPIVGSYPMVALDLSRIHTSPIEN